MLGIGDLITAGLCGVTLTAGVRYLMRGDAVAATTLWLVSFIAPIVILGNLSDRW